MCKWNVQSVESRDLKCVLSPPGSWRKAGQGVAQVLKGLKGTLRELAYPPAGWSYLA